MNTTRRIWMLGLRAAFAVGLVAPSAHAAGPMEERVAERTSSISEEQRLEQEERRFASARVGEANLLSPGLENGRNRLSRTERLDTAPPSRVFDLSTQFKPKPTPSLTRAWIESVRSGATPVIKAVPPKEVLAQITQGKNVVLDRPGHAVYLAPEGKAAAGEPIIKFDLPTTGVFAPRSAEIGPVEQAPTAPTGKKIFLENRIFESPGVGTPSAQSGDHAVPVLFAPKRFFLTAPHERAIGALADFVSGPTNSVDRHLSGLAFEPAPHLGWEHLSAVDKIRSACEAAEIPARANGQPPGEGATAVLAKLSRSLARQYDAVLAEPSLTRYLNHPAPDKITFTTAGPGVTPPAEATWLTPPKRAAIAKLANYAESGVGHLGAHATLTKYFNLTDDDAFDSLSSSSSIADAFTKAAAKLSPDARDVALAGAAQAYAKQYHSLRADVDLAPYMLISLPRWPTPASGGATPRGPPAAP
jgi:hypothetical protein